MYAPIVKLISSLDIDGSFLNSFPILNSRMRLNKNVSWKITRRHGQGVTWKGGNITGGIYPKFWGNSGFKGPRHHVVTDKMPNSSTHHTIKSVQACYKYLAGVFVRHSTLINSLWSLVIAGLDMVSVHSTSIENSLIWINKSSIVDVVVFNVEIFFFKFARGLNSIHILFYKEKYK